jgi:hypothetical protein
MTDDAMAIAQLARHMKQGSAAIPKLMPNRPISRHAIEPPWRLRTSSSWLASFPLHEVRELRVASGATSL